MTPFKDREKQNAYLRKWRAKRAEKVKRALALLEEKEKASSIKGE